MRTGLIVALDVDTLEQAESLVQKLAPAVDRFKIGSQLFTIYGPQAAQMVSRRGGRVFLDLKFHDIPNTVRNAVRAAAALPSVFMMTVHASGGVEMMRSAMEGAREGSKLAGMDVPPAVVGVTVLTSGAPDAGTALTVLQRANAAKEAGISGVVCSVLETADIRKKFGSDFIIVNPGIRPAGAEKGDQKRVATPADAVAAGASYVVVGRPVIASPDPLKAARDILEELERG